MTFMNAVEQLNPEHAVSVSRPTIQYKRGDLKSKKERINKGSFQLPIEQFGHIIADKMKLTPVEHSGGVVIDSYLLGEIHLAVLGYQKKWFVIGNDGRPEYLQKGEYQAGAKSRLRVMAVVKELCDVGYAEPCILTFSGLNAKAVEDAIKAFKNSVITTASRLSGHRFPLYSFWARMEVGPMESTRNNQYVTPPQLAIDGEITKELCESLYIGDELLLTVQSYWDECQEWIGQAEPAQPKLPDTLPPYVNSDMDVQKTADQANGDDEEDVLVNTNAERVTMSA